jgi:hypothetical protein
MVSTAAEPLGERETVAFGYLHQRSFEQRVTSNFWLSATYAVF